MPGANGKKKRAHKVSKALHGAGGRMTRAWTPVELVLMGKGPLYAAAVRTGKGAPARTAKQRARRPERDAS